MSAALVERGTGTEAAGRPIVSAREVLPYLVFAGVLLALLVYFAGAEQGAASLVGGSSAHELVHDARHLLGFPCH